MKIQKIKITNLLGIDELEFEPGKFTLIEGKNGSGKTSILESIKHALNGGHDGRLLRNGADKGEIVLILDDGMQLTRTVTSNKSEIKIFDKNGNKINKPQSFVDKLIDMVSVNPIQFLIADKKDRLNYLLESLPMQLTKKQIDEILNGLVEKTEINLSGHALEVIDNIYKQLYNERTGVNRALKEKTATIVQLTESISQFGEFDEEISNKLTILENKKREIEQKKESYIEQAINVKTKKLEDEEKWFNDEINKLRETHEINKRIIYEQFEARKAEILAKFDEKYFQILKEIAILHEQQKQLIAKKKTKELIKQFSNECSELKKESDKLGKALNNLENLKNDLIKNLPIKDLEIKNGEIYYKGVVFDKLNTAEQVKIAVEIAKLRANELGIICVDGIEKLDSETFEEFKQKAIESGLQMIVTKVGDSNLNIKNLVN